MAIHHPRAARHNPFIMTGGPKPYRYYLTHPDMVEEFRRGPVRARTSRARALAGKPPC